MKRKIFLDNGQKIFQKSGAKPPKLGEEPLLLTVTGIKMAMENMSQQ